MAQREHDAFVDTLAALGPRVHVLEAETGSPDLVYTFDPLLVTDRGAIPLRPGKPNRARPSPRPRGLDARRPASRPSGGSRRPGRSRAATRSGCGPTCSASGGRCARTTTGARQLAELVGGDVRIFDVPYWHGPGRADPPALGHLAGGRRPGRRLPAAAAGRVCWQLLGELGVRLIEVPDEEFPTLGCNVLAVRPGVVIVAEGNPRTAAALAAAGCEVHTYPATEIGINGSGGPTCLTRPILRG